MGRLLLDRADALFVPNWPTPSEDREFVRHFGAIRARRRGGLVGIPGEDRFCDSRKAVRICTAAHELPLAEFTLLYRRLYFDGNLAGRLEIGMAPRRKSSVSPNSISNLLKATCAVATGNGSQANTEIGAIGKTISSVFARASRKQVGGDYSSLLPDRSANSSNVAVFVTATPREPQPLLSVAVAAIDGLEPSFIDSLIDQLERLGLHKRTTTEFQKLLGGIVVNQYTNYGTAGIIGPNASNNTVNVNATPATRELILELRQLAEEMAKRATSAEEKVAAGNTEAAANALNKEPNASGEGISLAYLKSAGKFALDVAKDIGVKIAVEFAKKGLGLP